MVKGKLEKNSHLFLKARREHWGFGRVAGRQAGISQVNSHLATAGNELWRWPDRLNEAPMATTFISAVGIQARVTTGRCWGPAASISTFLAQNRILHYTYIPPFFHAGTPRQHTLNSQVSPPGTDNTTQSDLLGFSVFRPDPGPYTSTIEKNTCPSKT